MGARTFTRIGTALAGLAVSTLAFAGAAHAAAGVIHVPDDFDHSLSDTRATGHYEVQGTGLHISTQGSTSTDKVAEYVDASAPLADVGEPSLSYSPTAGTIPPGYQLVVDFDGNGTADGILVGEPTFYGNKWWLSNGSAAFVKAGAPHSDTGGTGSQWYGTLDEWRTSFGSAVVKAFGFSLGSGVYGDGVIHSITFNGTTYTFAASVHLTSKDQCKKDGWQTSTAPVFKNQGDCVSYFASGK
jgi:hypothetical protein